MQINCAVYFFGSHSQ